MLGPPITIALTDAAIPHRVNGSRPISIPFAYREGIEKQLDDMVADGIVESVCEATEQCNPNVIVKNKNSSEMRRTVDLRKLNDQVRRLTHPMTTTRAALSAIGTAKFNALDARNRY